MSASSPAPAQPAPAEWAALLAQRLFSVRAQCIHEAPDERAAKLEEVLRGALQEIAAERRADYLAAIADYFPSWQQATADVLAPRGEAGAEPTPEQAVDTLLALWPKMSPAQRDQAKQRLASAGIAATSVKPLEGEALAEVQAKLKLAPNDPVDPQRLGKLFATFAEVTLALDQLVWNVWRSAAPKSPIRREGAQGDLRALVRRSLAGDAEASVTLVQQQLESTRQLIAGLLAGLGPAGQDFAKKFQERYSPEAIRAAVLADGGAGFFGSAEAKCWKRYADLGVELTDTSIEGAVREAVIRYAEDLIRGRRG